MDNRSYLGSIVKYEIIGFGTSSDVYQCDYFDSLFAFKEFKDPQYVSFINDRIQKLKEYYYDETDYVFPYKCIYKSPKDNLFVGYIMDYLFEYKKLSDIDNLDYNKKIIILKKLRDLVDKFHYKYNFIHTDICPWNIFYNEKKDNLKLFDFDTYIDLGKNDNIVNNLFSEYTYEYAHKVGIDKDLDIFLYNLTVYSFLAGIDYNNALEAINNNKLDFFDNEHVKKIFEGYKNLECKKTLKKEYVIDYL